jgi:hypothetical protein
MAARLLIVVDPVSPLDLIRSEHSPASNCKYISFTVTEDPTSLFLHNKNSLLNGKYCLSAQAIEHPFLKIA